MVEPERGTVNLCSRNELHDDEANAGFRQDARHLTDLFWRNEKRSKLLMAFSQLAGSRGGQDMDDVSALLGTVEEGILEREFVRDWRDF